MKITIFVLINILFFAVSTIFSQVSPIPVTDAEMRDSISVRSRTLELERIKRDANKVNLSKSTIAREMNFAEVKKDFEKIQNLQFEIIKAYTTGKQINYKAIQTSSLNMKKSAAHLESILFISETNGSENKKEENSNQNSKTIKELIIELDAQVGEFVSNELFRNKLIVDIEIAEKAHFNLLKIQQLSEQLSKMSAEVDNSHSK